MLKLNTPKLISQLPLIVVLVMLLALLVERCHRDPGGEYTHTIDTLYITKTDTITRTVTETEFKWVDRIIYRDIPIEVDTLTILADYFAVRFYEREYLKILIRDSVSQNKIIFSEMDYTFYRDTVFVEIHEKEIINQFKRGFYGHLDISLNSLSPGIGYMNRKGYQIGLGVHLYNIDGVRLSPHLRFSVPL